MGNKERARAWRRAQRPGRPQTREEWVAYMEDCIRNPSWWADLFQYASRGEPPPPRFENWECGQDIQEGRLVYGISRVFVAQPGAAITRCLRGLAVENGRKGETIKVQTYGMATIPVEVK